MSAREPRPGVAGGPIDDSTCPPQASRRRCASPWKGLKREGRTGVNLSVRNIMSTLEASSAAAPLPRRPDPARVQRIADDAGALAAAHALAAQFATGAAERDRKRLLPWAELDLWS